MRTESPEGAPRPSTRSAWRDWLQVFALALLLLVLSEVLWLWQTWPVRELLAPPAPHGQAGRAR